MKTKIFGISLTIISLLFLVTCKNPEIGSGSFIVNDTVLTEACSVTIEGSYFFTDNVREINLKIGRDESHPDTIYPLDLSDTTFFVQFSVDPDTAYHYYYSVDFGWPEEYHTESKNFSTKPTYTIKVSAIPSNGGTVTGGGTFEKGQSCTVKAIAHEGYTFEKWTKDGTDVSTNSTYTFLVTESAEYVAHFQGMAINLNVFANPTVIAQGGSSYLNAVVTNGNGSFTYRWTPASSLNNDTIQNPTASPTETTTYTCTATTIAGLTESNNCTVTVVCPPTNLTATEQNDNNVHLAWTAPNSATSYKVYRNNTVIAPNVTSTTYTDSNLDSGTYSYRVSAVYQDVESPKSNATSVTIYDLLNVTATANPTNAGTITGAGAYVYGTTATLVAIANEGYTFTNWTENGNVVSTNANYPFTVTGDRALVANFEMETYTIEAKAEPEEGGIPSVLGTNVLHYGDRCRLIATPNPNYKFVNWTKDGTQISTEASCIINVTESAVYVAHFQLRR